MWKQKWITKNGKTHKPFIYFKAGRIKLVKTIRYKKPFYAINVYKNFIFELENLRESKNE